MFSLPAGRCLPTAAPTSTSRSRVVMQTATPTTQMTSTQFLRPHLLKLAPYTPIEPFEILSQRYGRAPQDIIKLDANENPYGPPPEVVKALAEMPFPHIYPDPETRRLRRALADMHNINIDHLLVGCGADELIDLLMRCVLEPGDKIIDCPPTFTMYVFDADVNDARVVTVPRKEGFKVDIEGIRKAVEEHKPKMVFLTSPNNPDGSMMTDEEIKAVLELPVLVVLDEAYIEFSDVPSKLHWVGTHPNLVVLRTFSKSAALAGLRVGYGAFPLDMAQYLWRAKQPYNVSVAAETAACAALTNMGYLDEVRNKLVGERERLLAGLRAIPWLEPYPSHSNFILAKVHGRDAKGVKEALAKDHGIMVRHYAKKELSGYIRVSVGRPEHTDKLLAALAAMH
mmetsp:Transcript_37467/g.94559  ORF Transcript_37467/g.94559 Transcript_37467/m.94559 type:complete len:397 (-) Transcript_37467:117-1307(-)